MRIVRSADPVAGDAVAWEPADGRIDASRLEGLDAVVHLAGEDIAARRWSPERKSRSRASRVQGTKLLSATLAELRQPPKVVVAASAVGVYGDRGDEQLAEASPSGDGFLAEVCREWEAATKPAADAGIRVVTLCFGIILSPKGDALAKMLTPFRLGMGGRIGSGRQWMSWMALGDAVGRVHHALAADSMRGPVNAVAPAAVTNRVFTETLGKVLSRPGLFPLPGFLARLAFGEMADELLLASTRVVPRALRDANYRFLYPDLGGALCDLPGKHPPAPATAPSSAATNPWKQPAERGG